MSDEKNKGLDLKERVTRLEERWDKLEDEVKEVVKALKELERMMKEEIKRYPTFPQMPSFPSNGISLPPNWTPQDVDELERLRARRRQEVWC